jgi:hypothetical protein
VVIAACASPMPSPWTTPQPIAPSTTPQSTGPFDELAARPLALPDHAADPCPVDGLAEIDPRVAPALGPGPTYPVMASGRVSLTDVPRGAFDRYHLKTLWVSTDPDDERILIRVAGLGAFEGRAPGVSGGHAVVDRIATELRLGPDASLRFGGGPMPEGWRAWSSSTLVDGPGCYTFQIDTRRATAHVVFEVVP